MLALTSPAFAGFEQVGTFGEMSETSPFINGDGVAVNVTGVGGVPAGTLYVVSRGQGTEPGLLVYGPRGEFIHKVGQFAAEAIAIDQSTGDVYVRLWSGTTGVNTIRVYSPDGSQLLTSFGVKDETSTIAASPEKLHTRIGQGVGSIAVNSIGDVYIADGVPIGERESRIMVFEPSSPGDYEHYVYAGRSRDIGYSNSKDPVEYAPNAIALDAAGNLYATSPTSESVYEFSPSEPGTPSCRYKVPGGNDYALTVNPQTGEVFYFSGRHRETIFALSACNADKEFVPTGTIALKPTIPINHSELGMAFNPTLTYGPFRPAGVIYGATETGLGYVFAQAEVRSPTVEAESAETVGFSEATLHGVVNANGWPTHYVFQYISDVAYRANAPTEPFAGAQEAPIGGAMLAASNTPASVAVTPSGLTADTEYHYRLLAASHCNPSEEAEVCEAVGTSQAFRTYPAEGAGLPDGRAYELVSPISKAGNEAFPVYPLNGSCGDDCKPGLNATATFPRQSSPEGDAVVYEGQPFSVSEGAQKENEYLSRRTGSGWQTTALSPSLQSSEAAYAGFDSSLSAGVLFQGPSATLAGGAPEDYPNLYSQLTGDPSVFSPLLTSPPPDRPEGEQFLRLRFAGGSGDLSHLFFSANDALTGETPFAPAARDGGAEKDNLYESMGGRLRLVNVLPGNAETAPGAVFGSGGKRSEEDFSHAVSEDGSRVFWSDEAGHVYARENGESTVAVPDPGRFLTASADGSKVLLTDGHLYDLQTEATTDLTAGQSGFQGITGQAEDLSRLYFVDTAVLTGGQTNGLGAAAKAGEDNLYAWNEGATQFVATLQHEDSGQFNVSIDDWVAAPQLRTAQASPDGRWAVFLSRAKLTGYDNTGPCNHAGGKTLDGPCPEAFVYDSTTGRLGCASCNPSGVPPLGRAYLPLIYAAPGSFGQARYLTDTGRVVFDTADSLSPFDTNGGVEDVYEYEPAGVGDCRREAGCVRLISSGRGAFDSNFLAMDATGGNVFFSTRDRLVPVDHDELMDVYDAREGGGIATQGEVVGHGECHGEACQPPAGGVGDPALASLSFEGASGLLAPAPAPVVAAKARSLTRAQKLARALRDCRRSPKRRRAACRRAAHRRFDEGSNRPRSSRVGGAHRKGR